MAYNADGSWTQEDDSVASNVAKLQSKDSALMRGAIASGTKAANRRGLANSSMGIGAGISAGLGAVTPIASQEAQHNLTKNISAADDKRARDLASIDDRRARDLADQDNILKRETVDKEIASNNRAKYMETAASLAASAQSGLSDTLQNDKIPSGTRSAAQNDIRALYQSSMQQLGAIYGVNLNWS